MTKSTTKVLLMSLKAGGVGLNLTEGNRVISLDMG
jgi:SNF2 family DNA or RNA helicase